MNDPATKTSSSTDPEVMRARAGGAAADYVSSGMVLGLGTGRTAEAFLSALGARVRDGLDIVGVPTSRRTAEFARELDIPISDLDAHPALDLTIDGADELDTRLRLIKGGGGALLREKIVAAASRDMLVIAEAAKVVDELGAFPLPIEIVPFGARPTLAHIERVAEACGLNGTLTVRAGDDGPFQTDNGNLIVDASLGRLGDPERLAGALSQVPGVVEHGLFINMASRAVIAGPAGVEWIEVDRN